MKIFALAVVTLLQAPSSSSAAVITIPEGSSTTVSCSNGGACTAQTGAWEGIVSSGTITFGRSVSYGDGSKLTNCQASGGCGLECSDDCTAPILTGEGAPAPSSTSTETATSTSIAAPATTTAATTSATVAASFSATDTVPEGSTGTVSCTNGGQCCLSPNSSWEQTLAGGTMTFGGDDSCSGVSAGDATKLQNCMTSGGCGLDCSADCTVLIDDQGAPAPSTFTETATTTATAATASSAATIEGNPTPPAPTPPAPSTEAPSSGNMAVVTLPVIGIAVAMLNHFI